MVVDKTSATLGYPNEISKSLNADHHTVCKFDGVNDPNYVSVRNGLKTLVTSVRATGKWLDAHVLDWPKQMGSSTSSHALAVMCSVDWFSVYFNRPMLT